MNSACRHILWLSFESTSHKYKMRFSIWGNLFNDYEKKNFTITPKVGNSQGVVALSCSSGVLRVLPKSPDCGHSNLTNGLKLLQHLEKKEGRKAKADWHHSLILWPGGEEPDAQSKRLTETRSGKQIRNCKNVGKLRKNVATPGSLLRGFLRGRA